MTFESDSTFLIVTFPNIFHFLADNLQGFIGF